MRRAGASLGLLARLARRCAADQALQERLPAAAAAPPQPCPLRCLPAACRGDAAAEALSCAPAGVQPVQAGLLPPLTAGGGGTATSGLHTSALGSFARSVSQPAINRWDAH